MGPSLSFPLLALLPLSLLAAAAPASADALRITEAVVDPQQDHSESSGGDGAPYEGLPGAGTVSTVDEFIEIYNAGLVTLDLYGFSVEFLDTSPESFRFGTTTSGVLRFSAGSSLRALLPGGFVVIGNPPGSINNAVELLLRDAAGWLLDRLAFDDGGARGPEDEAVARAWQGATLLDGLVRAPASPLGPTPASAPAATPTPEPGTLLLVGLSLIGAARARARKGGRACRRRSAA